MSEFNQPTVANEKAGGGGAGGVSYEVKYFKIDMDIAYAAYTDEAMLPEIMGLVSKDLSEPYSIFTYRYFISNWPSLCTCVYEIDAVSLERKAMIAVIVSKAELDRRDLVNRGYIAMVAVNKDFRKRGIAFTLVNMNIENMMRLGATECTLEAEIANKGALGLYEKLGFSREEMLGRYYLNGGDAYKLRLNLDKMFVCRTCDLLLPVSDRAVDEEEEEEEEEVAKLGDFVHSELKNCKTCRSNINTRAGQKKISI